MPILLAFLFAVGSSLSPFLPRIQPASLAELEKATLMPSFSWSPPIREDAMTVVELVRRLDGFGEQGKSVALLSSSLVLNYDILINAEASLSLPRVSEVDRSYLMLLPAVDQRDGWSDSIFWCDIAVVADPIQLHLGRENQAVVALPAEEILTGQGIGAAFRPLGESFVLSDGVTVRLFERVREITWEEVVSIREKYIAIHPEVEF